MMRTVLLLAATTVASSVAAQDVATACSNGEAPAVAPACIELALALQAAQGDLGLLGSGGIDLPGATSTLGKRVGSGPRFSVSGRIAAVGFEGPDLSSGASGPAPGRSAMVPALQGTIALGLFRGFSPSPTMGGVFAVDLLAAGTLLSTPDALGYHGAHVGYGLGARLGIFRESFTLPGITLTAAQRWIQGVEIDGVDARALSFGVSTTSLRAVVGKDLWGFGWTGGVGWDESSSDGTVTAPAGGTASFENASDGRGLLFVGVTWTYFVVQLSGELGWASGWSAPEGRSPGAYDPASGRLFGGLSVRLIY